MRVIKLPPLRSQACRARTIALLIALVGSSLFSASASAEFGSVKRVISGTAYTLEEGEFIVGVVGPLQFGILDDLTISTHPILDVLLTPNLALRYKLLDSGVALSMNVSYIETFLDPEHLLFPGTVAAFPMLTVPLAQRMAITAQAGYLMDISPIGHGFLFGGTVLALITPSDIVSVGFQDEYYRGRGIGRAVVLVTYSHAFYQLRFTVGAAIGKFPIQVGTAATDIKDFPIYPVVDIWWQL